MKAPHICQSTHGTRKKENNRRISEPSHDSRMDGKGTDRIERKEVREMKIMRNRNKWGLPAEAPERGPSVFHTTTPKK